MRNETVKSIGKYVVYKQVEDLPDGDERVLGYFVEGTRYDDEASAVEAAQTLHDEQQHPAPQG